MSLLNKARPTYKKKTLIVQKTQPQKNLYSQLLITRTLPINITHIGNTVKETLEKAIAAQIEGKCIVEGFIKPRSVEVITFSSGLVMGSNVIFEVVIQCEVCSPVEGMHIKCIAKHINKAGIRAEINETPSPVVIFIARDHNYASPLFADVKENDEIKVRVIGQRFELNDKYISIIAEITDADSDKLSTPAAVQTAVVQSEAPLQSTAAPLQRAALPSAAVLQSAAPLQRAPLPSTAVVQTEAPKKKATIRIKLPKITVKN